MFHEGKDLESLFGALGIPKGFPKRFSGFAGTGRSLVGKPAPSGGRPAAPSSPSKPKANLKDPKVIKFIINSVLKKFGAKGKRDK